MKEVWKDIIGYEGYYKVSNLGNVFGVKRNNILKPKKEKYPYKRVELSKPGKKSKNYLIHRLVAEAFIPNPDALSCVLHKDDDPTNNMVKNLMWGTHQDNMNMMKEKKRYKVSNGEENKNSKYTESQVIEIKKLSKQLGFGYRRLAKYLGVSENITEAALKGWKHLEL